MRRTDFVRIAQLVNAQRYGSRVTVRAAYSLSATVTEVVYYDEIGSA